MKSILLKTWNEFNKNRFQKKWKTFLAGSLGLPLTSLTTFFTFKFFQKKFNSIGLKSIRTTMCCGGNSGNVFTRKRLFWTISVKHQMNGRRKFRKRRPSMIIYCRNSRCGRNSKSIQFVLLNHHTLRFENRPNHQV